MFYVSPSIYPLTPSAYHYRLNSRADVTERVFELSSLSLRRGVAAGLRKEEFRIEVLLAGTREGHPCSSYELHFELTTIAPVLRDKVFQRTAIRDVPYTRKQKSGTSWFDAE